MLTGAYIEGSISFLRVRDARGELVVDESAARGLRWRVRRRLPAGRYRLTSFERPCDGNCSLLDPPTDRCSRRIKVIAHGRTGVRATVRPGRGCRLRVRARPALFPPPERVQAARRFLSRRAGIVSWALIDSHGRTHGLAARRTFISASLVKAMLLVAYLRQAGNRLPSPGERALLGPMITRSDNGLATAVFARVGDAGLRALAARAGMRSFSVSGYWSGAHFSAADQARFFRVFDLLVPKRSRAYARGLLSSIVAWQRWGFSSFSQAAGFHTFFKGGWRSTGLGQLVHEAALFERGPLRVSMAVLSDGNPSHDYGTATLRGAASAFSGRPPGRASAASSTSSAPPPAFASSSPTRPATTSPGGGCRATARTGPSSSPTLLARSRASSAVCAAAGSACSCATPTGPRAPRVRSCAGPSAAAAATWSARTSRVAAATTRAAPST